VAEKRCVARRACGFQESNLRQESIRRGRRDAPNISSVTEEVGSTTVGAAAIKSAKAAAVSVASRASVLFPLAMQFIYFEATLAGRKIKRRRRRE